MAHIELVVPASGEYVGLVRMVVSAMVSPAVEDVDDLLVAVSEACTLAVHGGSASMTIGCAVEASRVVVSVDGVGAVTTGAEIDPYQLMRALVDEVSMEDGTVRLVQRCVA